MLNGFQILTSRRHNYYSVMDGNKQPNYHGPINAEKSCLRFFIGVQKGGICCNLLVSLNSVTAVIEHLQRLKNFFVQRY